jgi:hypothetical protein
MPWKPAHPKIRQLQNMVSTPPPQPDRMLPLHPVTRAGGEGGARFLFEERVVSSVDSESYVMNGFLFLLFSIYPCAQQRCQNT